MKERFRRFMYGRYGMDTFGRTLFITSLVFYIVSSIINSRPLYTFAVVIMCYEYFRMFSRNTYRRAAENQTYLNKTAKLRYTVNSKINQIKQQRTHRIYKCPTCKQKIRVPRGKGRIEIRCPKCQTKFIKKS